jgi:hypothetical protein
VIDDINALRQGQLEKHWPTRDGWFRISTTIIGMVITDAFQISQRTRAGPKGASIKSFANHLAGTALKPLVGRKRRASGPDDGQGWGAHQPCRIEKKARAAPPASDREAPQTQRWDGPAPLQGVRSEDHKLL